MAGHSVLSRTGRDSADFNLLEFFHFPGPDGPGAFATPILIKGFLSSSLMHPSAHSRCSPSPRATPCRSGSCARADYRAAMADNVVTIGDVIAMQPLRGIATKFNETLKPRTDDHLTIITASGKLDDGRTFDFRT